VGSQPSASQIEIHRLRAARLPQDRYSILGLDISLRTDSAPVRAFFAEAYRWFPPRSSATTFELSAIFNAASGAFPSASAGDAFIDLSTSRSAENRAFLFLFESIMDGISGSILLHGAAVSKHGRGIILAGPTLAGKSTLVMELVKVGHQFLSDDAAPLERSTGDLLPFPRAIGIRKGPSAPRLPARGVHELPHKWLVDPVHLGARLPAASCRPEMLFYLDPAGILGDRSDQVPSFEIALADSVEPVHADLLALRPESVRVIDEGPFPRLAVRFGTGSRPLAGLTHLWRRHRESILFVEETRDPRPRRTAAPEILAVDTSDLLLPLVRDVLNRGEEGALMRSHCGRLTSLVIETAKLLKSVRCYRVASGTPETTALAIDRLVREEKGRA
jgi:hypothetical protein